MLDRVTARRLSRRRMLGLAAGAGIGIGVGGIGIPALARAQRHQAGPRSDPVSMAMHIHACFSEGMGSMHAQLEQAKRHGLDVIWWTEHDFRMQAHGYRDAVHFDGPTESEHGIDWTWGDTRWGDPQEATAAFVTDPHTPDEPGRALLLRARADSPDWAGIQYEGAAWNSTYTTCLVDTTLEIDVLASSVGPDAELVVEIATSYRPATAGRPAGQYALQYRVGAAGRRSTDEHGLLGVVPVARRSGWQRLRLRPVDDIAALWPDLVAGDSGLYRLRLLARARRGGTAAGAFDRLRFTRSGRTDSLGLQADLIRRYASRYPGVGQIQAAELSLVQHINTFGGNLSLPDYGAGPPRKNNAVSLAEAMVQRVHSYGGVASYNHPLVGDARDLARLLISSRNLGAEVVEIGCKQDVEKLSYAYDAAARNGVFATATGVTDDHSGLPWVDQPIRWVTSAWAPSTDTADLAHAVGAGRAWFWDLTGWRGTFDLRAHGKPAMGGVLVSSDRHVAVEVAATDLPTDGSLDIVVGRVDFAGPASPEPATVVHTTPARQNRSGTRSIDVTPGTGAYVRAVVRDGAGAIVGYSNPVWMLPKEPPAGIPAARRL